MAKHLVVTYSSIGYLFSDGRDWLGVTGMFSLPELPPPLTNNLWAEDILDHMLKSGYYFDKGRPRLFF